MRRISGVVAAVALTLSVAACNQAPTGSSAPAGGGGSSSSDGACPTNPDALSSATGLTFELGTVEKDHKLETVPGVNALVCVFTATNEKIAAENYGDPLVLRVDVVEGADADKVRAAFERTCAEAGRKVGPSSVPGARTCADTTATEGEISKADRVVEVYYVSTPDSMTQSLSDSFDKVLATVG